MDATVLDASVEAQFREWDLGVLMLGRIDRCATARSSMHRLAAATLWCFQPNGPGAELSAVLSTAFSLILPIDAILDGDAEPLESGVEPVRASLVAVAAAALFLERVIGLPMSAQGRGRAALLAAEALRAVAAGEDWDAVSDGTEQGYWRAVRGKAEAGAVFAVELAAGLSGAPEPHISALRALARAIGRLDQIEDDLVDVMTEPPSGDWRRPHCNLLLLYGLIPGMPGRERLAEAIAAARDRDARDDIRRRLLGAGAEAYAAHAARSSLEHATQALSRLPSDQREPLADELRQRRDMLAILIGDGAASPNDEGARHELQAEPPALAWPLLDEASAVAERMAGGILSEFAYAVRLLRDWREGRDGLHRKIGDGRTANLAMGLAGAGFSRIASLPLPDPAKTPAVLAAARAFAAAMRGVDDGYCERTDAPDLTAGPLAQAAARIERLLQEASDEEGVAQLSEIVPCATRS